MFSIYISEGGRAHRHVAGNSPIYMEGDWKFILVSTFQTEEEAINAFWDANKADMNRLCSR